eukprot:EG_transcript_19323
MMYIELSRFASPELVEDNGFECCCCMQVPCVPYRGACGHLGCEPCLSTWAEKNGSCFMCRQPLKETDIVPLDGPRMDLFNSLLVRCAHHEDGCSHCVPVEVLHRHEEQCAFVRPLTPRAISARRLTPELPASPPPAAGPRPIGRSFSSAPATFHRTPSPSAAGTASRSPSATVLARTPSPSAATAAGRSPSATVPARHPSPSAAMASGRSPSATVPARHPSPSAATASGRSPSPAPARHPSPSLALRPLRRLSQRSPTPVSMPGHRSATPTMRSPAHGSPALWTASNSGSPALARSPSPSVSRLPPAGFVLSPTVPSPTHRRTFT